MHSRRRFITAAGGFVAASVVAPAWAGEVLAASSRNRAFKGGKFAEGVMAGDPTPNGITLWTRVHDVDGAGSVKLEVAREKNFRKLVASENLPTAAAADHAVKARVGGLKPYEQYYYRFATADAHSDVGRFRTALPADSNQPVTFAFFSCQDYTGGYYNAHAQLAKDDVDFVVNLGDYIYADRQHEQPGKGGDNFGLPGRVDPVEQARSLQQYRDKYKLYRSDKNLRKMQSMHALVSTWDDHEVTDDYAGAQPQAIAKNAASPKQIANAYRAFFESMPLFSPNKRTQLFRMLRFGKHVDLLVLDERQYRDAQPCGDPLVGNLDPASPNYCSNLNDPRTMLGAREGGFLTSRLASSNATWKVIANEVPITPIKLVQAFVGPDDWAGYTQARGEIIPMLQNRAEADVVFVTGDVHTFITTGVPISIDDPTVVAPEFVGGSITSFGFGEVEIDVGGGITLHGNPDNPGIPPDLQSALLGLNPWAIDTDTAHHGYAVAKFDASGVDCEYVRMATTRQKGAGAIEPLRYTVPRGARVPQKV
jgi:alkaline phosphatase D